IRTADEIEIVDVPAEYCLQRARETGPDFERLEQQLSELREIALLLAADVVDHQLEEYLHGRGIEHLYGTQERILLCLTPRSNASLMIQRGRRQADRFHGELHAVYVKQGDLPETVQRVLDSNLEAARDAEAQVEILQGDDPVDVILRFAVKNGITQIFTGHSEGAGWTKRWKPNFVERLIMESEGIDVRIFPQTGPRDA
ncbi:MAG TPA: hypothetical protein VM120_18235, partial [Bryobacteraceae bacterium]|nr:hypothetical protein [Bryobacteraceae bacterium]